MKTWSMKTDLKLTNNTSCLQSSITPSSPFSVRPRFFSSPPPPGRDVRREESRQQALIYIYIYITSYITASLRAPTHNLKHREQAMISVSYLQSEKAAVTQTISRAACKDTFFKPLLLLFLDTRSQTCRSNEMFVFNAQSILLMPILHHEQPTDVTEVLP